MSCISPAVLLCPSDGSPVARRFPDKRGLATGAAVMGFGGGAMVAAPLDSYLLSYYSSPPTLLGGIDEVQVVTEGGVRMAESGTPVRKEHFFSQTW